MTKAKMIESDIAIKADIEDLKTAIDNLSSDSKESLVRHLNDTYDTAKDNVDALHETIISHTLKNPIKALSIALFAGLVIGKII